jgi:RecB family endonuclease NucS
LLEQVVYESPQIIEDGLKWELRQPQVSRADSVVDLAGIDSNGTRVFAEIKLRVKPLTIKRLRGILAELPEDGRFIVVSPQITEYGKSMLEQSDIEFKHIDYSRTYDRYSEMRKDGVLERIRSALS